MFRSMYRMSLVLPGIRNVQPSRFINNSFPVVKGKYGTDQVSYIKSVVDENTNGVDWTHVKSNTLSLNGSMNEKNIDAVILKLMVNERKLDAALSFANHLKSTNSELNLGTTNGLMKLYYELGKEKLLSTEDKKYVLEIYKDLYKKYKFLDSVTCEHLLHVLCVLNEWKKALKVLDDIHLSSKPSHSAYTTIIATLFDLNKKVEAFELIEKSLNANRPLQTIAYEAWINYILRKYKCNKTKLKYFDEICSHILFNSVKINTETADKIQEVYKMLGWDVRSTSIRKADGQCQNCNQKLDCFKLSEEDFTNLQQIIKEKLIVGSDLFLKTSPQELERFTAFLKKTAPYDVVLDALNISYISRFGPMQKVTVLNRVVDYFANKNMRMLLIGRKYMLGWPKSEMKQILNKTCNFFIDDISQDDPYFITAAILSGSHTDIVSKDLLRGHLFQLKDKHLRMLFQRWQWQHQWMVFLNRKTRLIVQPPLQFTPCAQNNNGTWHLPLDREEGTGNKALVNDGTPDLTNWLCLRLPES